MKGTLTDQPLAELIREIFSKRLSGTLRLEFERAKTAVYFEHGVLIYAASNIRSLRLREYLTKRDLVSESALAGFKTDLADLALASVLRANGHLQAEQIQGLVVALVADVLRVALLWTEGTWDFDERSRLAEAVRVRVDTVRLLREAAQRLPEKFVSHRFRNPSEFFTRAGEIPELSNSRPEALILSSLDSPTTLEQLLTLTGLEALEVHQVLYGLTLNGFVEREYWKNAFRTEAPKAVKDSKEGVTGRAVAGAGSAESRWTTNEEADLENFFARIGQANTHYEVIDLPPTADAEEIKGAYYALARRYHPDRFHVQSGTSLHSRISSAFARITQAYETLTDPNARSTYDATIERARKYAESRSKTGPSDSLLANAIDRDMTPSESELGESEYNFREGVGALEQGRIDQAITYLATASHLEPSEARYRAYYGRALGGKETTRRLAETEIQAAVKLEPDNAIYRIMLAELYFDLRFHRRAQTELDRALSIDPTNPTARSLLRKLEKSRKVG